MAKVTIGQLARDLGLSKAAVSEALRGTSEVSAVTQARVRAHAKAVGWAPSASARALSMGRSDAVGMVLLGDRDLFGSEQFYLHALAGMERYLSSQNMSLILRICGSADAEELGIYRQWSAETRVDGVILFDQLREDPRPEYLASIELPYVVFDSSEPSDRTPRRKRREWTEAQIILMHLVVQERTSLLHVTGPLMFAHECERVEAMCVLGEELGLHVEFREGDYTVASGERLTAEWSTNDPMRAAVVTSNDLMAVGANKRLIQTLSAQVGVVSWDDSVLCQHAGRPITALDRRVDERASEAVARLVQRIGRAVASESVASVPVLIPRESTRVTR